MEFIRKVIIWPCIFFLLQLLTGCASTNIVDDPLVLLELDPLPQNVEVKKQVVYEPVYGVMRVLEITVKNGVQNELMAKKGDIKEGIEKGKTGEISEDSSFSQIIGTFTITGIQGGFVICKVDNVTKKIPANAYIRVQVGQKIKE